MMAVDPEESLTPTQMPFPKGSTLQDLLAETRQYLAPQDVERIERAYELAKQAGEYVGWFGIVRQKTFDAAANETRLTLEHKYFDGLIDAHMQVVSIYGAGRRNDFSRRGETT